MSRPATDSRDLILAIDAGTQSIRAAIVDLSGDILSLVKLPLNPCAAPHPGWAEQDPDYYWDTLCQACHHNTPAGAKKPPRCVNCHGKPFDDKQPNRPGLKAAYHGQCMSCHKAMDLKKPVNTDCVGCHKEKKK